MQIELESRADPLIIARNWPENNAVAACQRAQLYSRDMIGSVLYRSRRCPCVVVSHWSARHIFFASSATADRN